MTDAQYEFEERAAILEYDAGMTRDMAESEAIRQAEEEAASGA